jgi:serine/threonine protein kinase
MALSVGTRLGPYEIQAAIGAGGMGEVHRARDTKLNRDVALKVLPETFSADPDRLAALFFMSPNGAVMQVAVEGGATWAATAPIKLFEGPFGGGERTNSAGRTYDVSPDASRFLMIKEDERPTDAGSAHLVVVQHWFEELKARVPAK